VVVESPGDTLIPLEITLNGITTMADVSLHTAWHTQEDAQGRPLALRRMLVPWAKGTQAERDTAEHLATRPPELEGGSWGRGRQVFFSEKGLCGKCHQVDGQGGVIGPDLSNLVHRDYASVKRDILDPSYAINPDHLSHLIRLVDGRTLTGVVADDDVNLSGGDAEFGNRNVGTRTVTLTGATLTGDQVAAVLGGAVPGSIALLHMNHPGGGTADGVRRAVPALRDRGFSFVALGDYPLA
jgi:putative heme-binding domain-containing protein